MTYKLIMRITDLQDKIEDWKREMCTEEELKQAILEVYKALEAERKPGATKKDERGII